MLCVYVGSCKVPGAIAIAIALRRIVVFPGFYSSAAAIMTATAALPAYMPFKLGAAPMKFAGTVEDALALDLPVLTVLEVVPTTAVGPAMVVLFVVANERAEDEEEDEKDEVVLAAAAEGKVEVTDATTSETVKVWVLVAVEVM